jgi:hypothetical protein
MSADLISYTVEAYNTAKYGVQTRRPGLGVVFENRVHDDDVAQLFGFAHSFIGEMTRMLLFLDLEMHILGQLPGKLLSFLLLNGLATHRSCLFLLDLTNICSRREHCQPLRKQEIPGIPITDPYNVSLGSQFLYFFPQNDFHEANAPLT